MKLIFYSGNAGAHRNNRNSIVRMCSSLGITFEYTTNIKNIKNDIYDILICNDTYIDPYEVPENVKIIYGPQFFVLPQGIFAQKYNPNLRGKCVYNTLSTWVKELYCEVVGGPQNFMIDMVQFPFSVDIEKFWGDPSSLKIRDCLIYNKHRHPSVLEKIFQTLDSVKMSYSIISYGSYSDEEYIKKINESRFMIVADAHESQGFALEEAMSMNIPMLVINATSMYDEIGHGREIYKEHRGSLKMIATSVPYWSEKCGIITTIDKLSGEDILEISKNTNGKYSKGREYIEEFLSDKVCMKRILDYWNI